MDADATNAGTADTAARARNPLALFAIEADSATPPFRQIHDTVIAAIATGSLLPGQQLPTVRALAAQLGLAVNTVAGSYRSLEAAGIVEGRGRAGTFVCLGDDPIDAEARKIALDAVAALRRLNIAKDRAIRLFGDAFDADSATSI